MLYRTQSSTGESSNLSTAPNASLVMVIPAYCESKRLPAFLETLASQLLEHPEISLLIVEDGSPVEEKEATLRSVAILREKFQNILSPLSLESNHGKGGAILEGWKHVATSAWLGFIDADGAISAEEFLRVFLTRPPKAEALFGSRIRLLGRSVDRGWKRHISGRFFAFLVGMLINPNVYDSQCGLKIISRQAWVRVRSLLTETGFVFDVNLLAALTAKGIYIHETPIDWSDIPGSKVRFLRDALRMVFGILRIRAKKKLWT